MLKLELVPKTPCRTIHSSRNLRRRKEKSRREDAKEDTLTGLLEDKEDGKKKLGKASALIAQIRREVDSKSTGNLESSNKLDSKGKSDSLNESQTQNTLNTHNTNKLSDHSLPQLPKEETHVQSSKLSPQQ